MTKVDNRELADGLEQAARVCWKNASEPDHSWDRATNLSMAQKLSELARQLRAQVGL